MEFVITAIIAIAVIAILYKNFKKSSSGECNCSGCTSKCPKYEEKNKNSRIKSE